MHLQVIQVVANIVLLIFVLLVTILYLNLVYVPMENMCALLPHMVTLSTQDCNHDTEL